MNIVLGHIVIYDALVSFTDVLLAVESLLFAFLISRKKYAESRGMVAILFTLLAVASLSGAAFHYFFPSKAESMGGMITWLVVTAATGLSAIVLWLLAAESSAPKARRFVLLASPFFFGGFMFWIAFVDYHYRVVVAFYAPALLAFGAAAFYKLVQGRRGWGGIFLGVLFSALAALAQVSGIMIAGYADHNVIYHVLQAFALFLLYNGYARSKA